MVSALVIFFSWVFQTFCKSHSWMRRKLQRLIFRHCQFNQILNQICCILKTTDSSFQDTLKYIFAIWFNILFPKSHQVLVHLGTIHRSPVCIEMFYSIFSILKNFCLSFSFSILLPKSVLFLHIQQGNGSVQQRIRSMWLMVLLKCTQLSSWQSLLECNVSSKSTDPRRY